MKRINKLAILVACLGIVLLTAGGSYSLFHYFSEGSTGGSITTNGVTFHYQEGNGSIALTNTVPVSNTDGKSLNNYFDFDITSETTTGTEISYVVTARLSKDSTLDPNVVKIYLTDQNNNEIKGPRIFGYLEQYSNVNVNDHIEKVIYEDTILEDTDYTKHFRARIWIDGRVNMAGYEKDEYYCDGVKVNSTNYISCSGTRSIQTVMTYEYNNKTFTITFNVYATGTKKAINPLLQFSPGLYDDNDNMVASWDTLVNTYGMDLDYYEKDNIQYTLVYTDDGSILYEDPDGEIIDIDTIQTSRPSIILARTPELATGTKLIVPDTIGTLPYGALKGADNLNTIILKSGITEIGDHSISSCPNLGYVEIPNTVTKIGYCAFCESYAIALLTVPSSVTEIGEYAFDELDQVIYAGPAVDPDGFNWGAWELNTSATTNNASFLFEDYTKTKIIKYIGDDVDVIIPDGVVEIASHAFENKSYIKSIEIPNTVTKIGEKAFAGCTGLDYLIVPNTVNNIGFKAFEDVELLYFFGSATYSTNDSSSWGAKYKNVQRKGDYLLSSDGSVLYAYLGNDSDIVLPSTVLSVYYQAFKDNINLNNVFIPKNIIVFGSKVFDGCSNLNSIIFEKTNSWEATDYESPPDPLDVTNSSTNVTYFTDTYLYAIIENSELLQEYYKTSNGKSPMAQK